MSQVSTIKKPVQLRIIFIFNALMMILPFIFYYVFVTEQLSVNGLKTEYILYTGFAYIMSFVFLVMSILKKRIGLFRAIIIINALIAIPAGAYIGMVVALISFLLSFNTKVKAYFAQ